MDLVFHGSLCFFNRFVFCLKQDVLLFFGL